jgi:hypothetical protein
MHNIRTNFRRFYEICKELLETEVDTRKNFQFYPVSPKMNDMEGNPVLLYGGIEHRF